MVSQLRSCGVRIGTRTDFKRATIGLAIAAIAAPFMGMSAGQAQQALPPPPSIPNSNELPSLAPVAPPSQGMLMPPPAGLPALPQESVYQATPPMPGVMPGTGIAPQGAMPELRASYYQVVVPTRTEDFATIANKMMAMGVRPDAIQARKAPIGPHLAVGPFINLGEAEGVSSYLRAGGMNARVFFNK
ncbi:MAG: hypothetical protein NW224_04455 [Leptolyngbyaceae cyanobacterium bins.302]|nr:hypothetical protein [Leptolyngbyaceae cyanobacterium bins.302]